MAVPVAGHALALRRTADDVELLAICPNGFRRNKRRLGEPPVCRIAEKGGRRWREWRVASVVGKTWTMWRLFAVETVELINSPSESRLAGRLAAQNDHC